MVFLHGFQATHLKSKQLGDRCYYFDAEAPPTNVGHLEVSCFFFHRFLDVFGLSYTLAFI